MKKKDVLALIFEEVDKFFKQEGVQRSPTDFIPENEMETGNMGSPENGEESSIQTSLHMINEYSGKLINIQDDVSWEDWMQDKLAIAARDLDSIYHKFEGDAGGQELAPMNEMKEEGAVELVELIHAKARRLYDYAGERGDKGFNPEHWRQLHNILSELETLEQDIVYDYKDDYEEPEDDTLYQGSLEEAKKKLLKIMKENKDFNWLKAIKKIKK